MIPSKRFSSSSLMEFNLQSEEPDDDELADSDDGPFSIHEVDDEDDEDDENSFNDYQIS